MKERSTDIITLRIDKRLKKFILDLARQRDKSINAFLTERLVEAVGFKQ